MAGLEVGPVQFQLLRVASIGCSLFVVAVEGGAGSKLAAVARMLWDFSSSAAFSYQF